MKKCIVIMALLVSGAYVWAEEQETVRRPWMEDSPLTAGVFTGEENVFGQLDLLLPLFRYDGGLLFFSPRTSISDNSQEEINLGVGLRHLLDMRYPVIVGANLYYDARWTRNNNRFDQLGIGVELLSDWFDARANYYKPENDQYLIESARVATEETERSTISHADVSWWEPHSAGNAIMQNYDTRISTRQTTTTTTSWQTFKQYESALEGFDAEAGVRLPVLEEYLRTRIFGGYQYFENPFGRDFKGITGRLEVRALNGLVTFDAKLFEDDDLNLTDYLVGVRVRLPIDARSRDMWQSPSRALRWHSEDSLYDRMTEMVMRDPKIQTRESGMIEDVNLRSTDVSRRVTDRTEDLPTESAMIMDDVAFVDPDNSNSGDGTAENPYSSIQDGVDSEHTHIYVHALADGEYRENIVVDRTKVIIGEGHQIAVHDGMHFGSGVHPVINGYFVGGPSMTVVGRDADETVIAGLRFVDDGLFRRPGLVIENANQVVIAENEFAHNTRGLVFDIRGDVVPAFSAVVEANQFYRNVGSGLHGDAGARLPILGGPLDTFDLVLRDNTFMETGTGVDLDLAVRDHVSILGENNHFSQNTIGMNISRKSFSPTPMYEIDFGGGALGSLGLNRIDNNTIGFTAVRIPVDTITVENNYWGGAAPSGLDLISLLPSEAYVVPASYLESEP